MRRKRPDIAREARRSPLPTDDVTVEVEIVSGSEGLYDYKTLEVKLELRGLVHLHARGPAYCVVVVVALTALLVLRLTGHLG